MNFFLSYDFHGTVKKGTETMPGKAWLVRVVVTRFFLDLEQQPDPNKLSR